MGVLKNTEWMLLECLFVEAGDAPWAIEKMWLSSVIDDRYVSRRELWATLTYRSEPVQSSTQSCSVID